MATLGEAVKLAAGAQRSASKPAAWMFGEVLAVSPLRILVDSRFEVGADQVVLMREFVAGQYATHTHGINPHTHTVKEHTHATPQQTTEEAEGHSHSVPQQSTEGTALTSDPTPLQTATEVYTGLLVGDKVVLLQNEGGQKFLVLGRV